MARNSEAADMPGLSSPRPNSIKREASVTSPVSSLQDTMQVVSLIPAFTENMNIAASAVCTPRRRESNTLQILIAQGPVSHTWSTYLSIGMLDEFLLVQ